MPIPLTDFPALTRAEARLIAHLKARDRRVCVISPTVPEAETDEVTLRASLVRELALGMVEGVPLPETGVRVQGAWIKADGPEGAETRGLDFDGCTLPGELHLISCRLEYDLTFTMAKIVSLRLSGSHLAGGLVGRGLKASGGVTLDNMMQVGGTLDLLGAELGGSLQMTTRDAQCRLTGTRGRVADASLGAIRAIDARGLRAGGGVRIAGLWTNGMIDLSASVITGDVRLVRIRHESSDKGSTGATVTTGISMNRSRVSGALLLSDLSGPATSIDLGRAEIGSLDWTAACWRQNLSPRTEHLRLGTLSGQLELVGKRDFGFLSACAARDGPDAFLPQPWEEVARVLRESGHAGAARAVLVEKERLQRKAKRARVWRRNIVWGWAEVPLRWAWDNLLGVTIRYGRQPMLAFAWLFGFWLLGIAVFSSAEAVGALKPNDPKIQLDPMWSDCHATTLHPTQYACFTEKARVTGYPAFNALVYSADTLVPVVSFEMQSCWLPDDRTPRGAAVRIYLWVHIVAGWGLTLLAVAGFSGLVKQDSK